MPPYNLLEIDHKENAFVELMGLDHFYYNHHPDEIMRFIPKKITFLNGETIDATNQYIIYDTLIKNKQLNGDRLSAAEEFIVNIETVLKKHILSKSPKPIKQIDFEVSHFEKKQWYFPVKNEEVEIATPMGKIYVDRIQNSQVRLRVPSYFKKNFKVYALYKDGRHLRKTGDNSNTYFSPTYRAYAENIKETYLEAKSKIENGDHDH